MRYFVLYPLVDSPSWDYLDFALSASFRQFRPISASNPLADASFLRLQPSDSLHLCQEMLFYTSSETPVSKSRFSTSLSPQIIDVGNPDYFNHCSTTAYGIGDVSLDIIDAIPSSPFSSVMLPLPDRGKIRSLILSERTCVKGTASGGSP